jgi:hypothetical protein
VPVIKIPYTINSKDIITPIPEDKRQIDILQLGRKSVRRQEAEKLFANKDMVTKFIYDGLYSKNRYQTIAESRISLNIHRDKPFSFNHHRIFEAWSQGSVVVSEPSNDLEFGIKPDTHLVLSEIDNMPEVCQKLLADEPRRHKMITAAQELLRKRYTPDHWIDKMLEILKITK